VGRIDFCAFFYVKKINKKEFGEMGITESERVQP